VKSVLPGHCDTISVENARDTREFEAWRALGVFPRERPTIKFIIDVFNNDSVASLMRETARRQKRVIAEILERVQCVCRFALVAARSNKIVHSERSTTIDLAVSLTEKCRIILPLAPVRVTVQSYDDVVSEVVMDAYRTRALCKTMSFFAGRCLGFRGGHCTFGGPS